MKREAMHADRLAWVRAGSRPADFDVDVWDFLEQLVREHDERAARPRACVVGVVRDGVGRILLGRRLKPDGGYGKWVLPGGGVEGRETFAQALVREVQEECGLTVYVGDPVGVYRHIEGETNNVVVLMAAWVLGVVQARGSAELERPRFFSAKQLAALDTTPATRELLELARDRSKHWPDRGARPPEGAS